MNFKSFWTKVKKNGEKNEKTKQEKSKLFGQRSVACRAHESLGEGSIATLSTEHIYSKAQS